ncbi:MAG: hypothetical protein ACFB9M_13515 [Myxococcota bacterium]
MKSPALRTARRPVFSKNRKLRKLGLRVELHGLVAAGRVADLVLRG